MLNDSVSEELGCRWQRDGDLDLCIIYLIQRSSILVFKAITFVIYGPLKVCVDNYESLSIR